MLGEVHGTAEAMAFVGYITCSLAADHRPVVLALEYPRDEQSSIDAFMRERDADFAETVLLQAPFWAQSANDGRSSDALLKLLHHARLWRHTGFDISVVAYDAPLNTEVKDADDRELSNAAFISSLLRNQGMRGFVVIHAGNIHARKSKGLPSELSSDRSFEPLGYRLRKWKLLHINMMASGGTAWFCSSDALDVTSSTEICGIHPLPEKKIDLEPFSLTLHPPSSAFDGIGHLGRVTASQPAKVRDPIHP